MWQRSATVTQYKRAEARARCERLRVGGYADWRMPSAIELVSIVDFDNFNPSIDAKLFPDTPLDPSTATHTPASYQVTSTTAGDPLAGWLVEFSYGRTSLDTTSLDRSAYLRCVRGPRAAPADTSAGRYDLSTDGIAVDMKTGLTWQRVSSATRRKLADAQSYCATDTGLPGTGWRVPTIKELMTLVDFTKPDNYRIDQTVFTVTTDGVNTYGVFWSATSVAAKPPYAQYDSEIWSVYFDRGANYYIDGAGYAYIRCVR
ncbi:MAG: DUF1566 domain-containing protein [Deltaproteobacteria bacterium]|nr:DUF1566 domain-containing protein [Deltaproteobacteria bacterium]